MNIVGPKLATRVALALVCLAWLLQLSQAGRNIIHFQSNASKEFLASFSWVLASLTLSIPCSLMLRHSSSRPRLLAYCFGGLLGALFLHTLGFNCLQYYLASQGNFSADSGIETARLITEVLTCVALVAVVSIGFRESDFRAGNGLPAIRMFSVYGVGLVIVVSGLLERMPLVLCEHLSRPPLSWVALEEWRLFFRPVAVALGGALLCFSYMQRLLPLPRKTNRRFEVVASAGSVILLLSAPLLVGTRTESAASLAWEGVYIGGLVMLATALLWWSITRLRLSPRSGQPAMNASFASAIITVQFIGCFCIVAGMLVVLITTPGPLRLMWDPPSDLLGFGVLPGLLVSIGSLGCALSWLPFERSRVGLSSAPRSPIPL